MDSNQIQCPYCPRQIKTSYLALHTRRFHQNALPSQRATCNIICALCKNAFRRRQEFRDHVGEAHEKIKQTTLKMNNWDEFEIWLKNEESKQLVRFTKERSPFILSNGNSRINFYCHYDNARRAEIIPHHERKRALKYKGSLKMKGCCPAEVIVEKHRGSTAVDVVYFSTHIGHENTLTHFRPSNKDEKKLSGKIEQGIPSDRILDDIRNDISHHAGREHFTDCRTLEDIAATLEISNWKRNSDDGTSLTSWVESVGKLPNNPVCLLKMQNSEHPVLKDEDFALVIVTEIQLQMMKEFGNRIVCIDSTHGTNKDDFQLTTLLVVDDHEEGFPVAFLISNRTDTVMLTIFFEAILCKLDSVPLSPTVFMSDDYPAYFNSWEAVMKPTSPLRRILCAWHVDKNWRKALIKVKGKCAAVQAKQVLVYQMLRSLLEELDETAFLDTLGVVMTELMKDKSTETFGKYFKSYANRPEMWAYCYHEDLGIDTNMKLENLLRLIEVVYQKGAKMQRIDSCVDTLCEVVRNKYFDRVLQLSRMKVPYIVHKINSAHRRSLEIESDDVEEKDSSFYVKSQTDKDAVYCVQKMKNSCSCNVICDACNSCIHTYQCSCPEYLIKCRMCKHIHKVCTLISEKSTGTIQNTSSVDEEIDSMMDLVIEENEEMAEENNNLREEFKYQAKLMIMEFEKNLCSSSSLRQGIQLLKQVTSCLKKSAEPQSLVKRKLLSRNVLFL